MSKRRSLVAMTVLAAPVFGLAGTALSQQAEGARTVFSFGQSLSYVDNPELTSANDAHLQVRSDLGFAHIRQTATTEFSLNADAALENGRGGDALVDPSLRLGYNALLPNGQFSLRASFARADVNDSESSIDFLDEDLKFGDGTRDDRALFLRFDTGLEGPVGLGLRVSHRSRSFSGTTDPTLFDTRNTDYGLTARFRISPPATLTFGLRQENYDAEDPTGTERRSNSATLGLVYDISPILQAKADVSYRDNRTTSSTGTSENDGFGLSLGLVRELPRGSVGATLSTEEELEGRRTTFTLDRSIDLPTGGLSFSVGAAKSGDRRLEPLVNASYRRETPRGALTFAVSQALRVDTQDRLTVSSSLNVDYSEAINAVSSWQIRLGLDDSNVLDADDDRRRVNLGLSYSRALTKNWDMVSSINHVRLEEDPGGQRSSNSISLQIRRDFEFLH